MNSKSEAQTPYSLTVEACQQQLPKRAAVSQKSDFGHVLVVGGHTGMAGAVRMAAEAAARVGAGLTSVATLPEHVGLVLSGRPELMVKGVSSNSAELKPLLDKATVVVLGPGLGQAAWSQALLQAVLKSELPIVLDADGLNLLAASSKKLSRCNWILTPHPGEAARLLKTTVAAIQADRVKAAQAIVAEYGGICVLKGAGTLVASSNSLAMNTTGNPGMASGGMGDVLAGVIGGLVAQGLSLTRAAEVGVCLHGAAGDLAAAAGGMRGLLASDLFPFLRQLVN